MTWPVVFLFLVPQVFYWGSQSPFLLTKALYLHLAGSFACLAQTFIWRRHPPYTGLPRALVASALFAGYAAARAPWFADVRPEMAAPFLWGGFLLVAWPTAAALQAAPGALPRYARLLVSLGALTATYALLQSLGVDLPLYQPEGRVLTATFSTGAGQPPFATLGNPNYLGEYLAALLPLAAAGALAGQGVAFWLTGGAAVVMAAALPLTLARGPWIGAAIGLAVAFLLAPRSRVRGRQILQGALALVAVSLLAATAMERWAGGTGPWGKLRGTLSQAQAFGEGRRLWWASTARMVADHPLAGVGEGRFREAYPPYQSRVLASLPQPDAAAVPSAPVESPHNDYLHVAAELGLPGLLLLLGVLGFLLAEAARATRGAEGPERAWRSGSLGGLTALLVAGLFGYPLHTASGLFLAAALSALAVAAKPGREARRPSPRWQGMLLITVTAFGFWQGAHLLPVYASSIHLHRGTEALLRKDVPAALQALERAHEVSPRDSELRVALGQAYLAAGRPDLALPHLQAGLRGFDSAPLRTILGRTHLSLGQMEAGEETLRVGVASFPGFPPLHLTYGILLARRGRDAEAARELKRALARDPGLADAHYWLGTVRARIGDGAGAGVALRRFLELAHPADPRVEAAAALLRQVEDAERRVDKPAKPVK